jgi:ferredoxin
MKISTLVCVDSAHPVPELTGEDVIVIEDLCHHPSEIELQAGEAERLVVAVHPGDVSLSDLQTGARRAGIDPLGVQVVDVTQPAARLEVAVAAARARAAAFDGSSPEQSKPVFQREVTRRSLLRFPRPHYVGAPQINPSICAAEDGCHACVEVCPEDAYQWIDGRIEFDKGACEPCGRCVTRCPAAAIDHPQVSPMQVAAQVDSLVTACDAVGIVFVCRRGSIALGGDWYEIEVPCTGMVPSTWLLAGILLGAAAVTAVPCEESGCPLAHDDLVAENRAYARAVLSAFDIDPVRVPDRPAAPLPLPLRSPTLRDPFGVHGMAEVAAGLASIGQMTAVRVADATSPIGIITIDPSTCTLCTMCSQTCPTGALEHLYDEEMLSISFDGALCTACGQCIERCPELPRGAIRLDPVLDSAYLAGGRRDLHGSSTLRCETCGGPIAPTAMMDRISSLLGDGYAQTMDYLNRRCLNCRGIA